MSTVTVRLIGGLGNQLFQYAAARALAKRHGAEVKLDLSGFESYGLRRYELGAYPIAATVATADELARIGAPPQRSGFLGRLAGRLMPRPAHHYREPHYRYDPQLARQPLPIFMDGYWQSELYFADAADVLRLELTPKEPLEPANADVADKIRQTKAVSVHVRRGDYVSNAHTNTYHGVCSLDYYRAAIAHIQANVTDAHLFIFSDDHDWTRDNLKFDLPTTYVTANSADRGFRDMQLMSLCKNHVIANSSFSWWGAWLNPSPSKIVVAPARWFAAGDNDTRDLLPEGWVRL
ncbi:MAG: alpha-1,2-fucosyltransferase [Chelatococcus sp.]|nr:MAG: alpha-1,2-fucosyltransferase [Chelatococcus sp.]